MYLRTTQRRNRDGSVVRYVQLARNRRKGNSTQAEVLLNLGREDQLDIEGLRRLVGSVGRYLDGTRGLAVEPASSGGLVVEGSRPIGASWLLDGLWQRLGIARVLGEVLGRRAFTVNMERVLFALVANRAVAPSSKLAAAEWASADVVIPGLAGMDEDQAYRAMDLLVEADVDGQVQEAVFFAVADLLNLEVDLLLFDTTSTYFEVDETDDEDDEPGLRRFGHSKDHRGDRPQVVIGLAVTREGIPVRCWTFPGNTNDQTVVAQVKDDLRGWRLGRVVWVVDAGFSADANLAYLTRAGGHWIAGERMRDGSPDAQSALARQGRYRTIRDNLRVKEVRVGEGAAARRFVICHNPDQAARDTAARSRQLAEVTAELERIERLRAKAAKRAKSSRGKQQAAEHARAECALRDHPTLGRWIRQTRGGRLTIDRAAIQREQRLDGKFLLSTSDPDLSAEDVALGYKNLLEAERAFRDIKTTLVLRPVYHRLDDRIRAHVLLCWLALLLVRVIERTAQTTWRTAARELGRIHLVTLTGPDGRVEHTTRLSPTQQALFRALKVPPPPPILAADPS